jgi:hypothetical protein
MKDRNIYLAVLRTKVEFKQTKTSNIWALCGYRSLLDSCGWALNVGDTSELESSFAENWIINRAIPVMRVLLAITLSHI